MGKQQHILEYLSKQNEWVTATQICNDLSVAKRSFQRYVSDLNEQYGNLIYTSKSGYRLNLSKYNEYIKEQKIEENRIQSIINQLMFSDEKINIYDLAESLYVSESTIRNDLKQTKRILSRYQLQLINANDFIEVEGSEKNKRNLIKDYTYGEATNGFIGLSSLNRYFPGMDANIIKNIITDEFNNHRLFVDDYTLYNLVLHLLIKVERTRGNYTINRKESEIRVHNLPFVMAESICNKISDLYNVPFSKVEIFETSILISASVHIDYSDNLEEVVPEKVKNVISRIITYASENFELDFNTPSFLSNFSLHIKNLYTRLDNGIVVKNPLLSQIKNAYPFIYEISVIITRSFFKEYDAISEDEIAYIALHLASHVEETQSLKTKVNCIIVSPEFYSLNKKMLNNLHQRYSDQLIITNIFPSTDELNKYVGNYELIITTMALPAEYLNKSVFINILLNRDDYHKLDNVINRILKEKSIRDFQSGIISLFSEEYFNIIDDEMDYKTILGYMADRLLQNNCVLDGFFSSVLEREKASSTAYGALAIPHSIVPLAEKTLIYVAINKKHFIWSNGSKVKIVFLLANNKGDLGVFKNIFDFISYYVTENIDLSSFTKATDYQEFLQIMNVYIQTMINKA